MHNIEPAHHALQQEVDWKKGGEESNQPVTRLVRLKRDKQMKAKHKTLQGIIHKRKQKKTD